MTRSSRHAGFEKAARQFDKAQRKASGSPQPRHRPRAGPTLTGWWHSPCPKGGHFVVLGIGRECPHCGMYSSDFTPKEEPDAAE